MKRLRILRLAFKIAATLLFALTHPSLAGTVSRPSQGFISAYYTPCETGFVDGHGFSLKLETHSGLDGRHLSPTKPQTKKDS